MWKQKLLKNNRFHIPGSDRPALHLNAESHKLAASIIFNNHKRCYCPAIFKFLREDCKPITSKQRFCLNDDIDFTQTEVSRLLAESETSRNIIPWQAQPFVVNMVGSSSYSY